MGGLSIETGGVGMGDIPRTEKIGAKIGGKGGGHFLDWALAPLIQFKKIDFKIIFNPILCIISLGG